MKKATKLYLIGIFLSCLFSIPALANSTNYQYDDLHRLTRVEHFDGTVTIYDYDAFGNRNSKVVTSNTTLSAQFIANPTSGKVPLNVTFTDQSIGNITSWQWDFGDSNTSAEQNPVHTYTALGNHTVTLTVENSSSEIDTKSRSDYINISGVQSGAVLSVDPQDHSVSSNLETITIDIANIGATGSNMNWTATENESWLTISSGSSGLNSGTVIVVVSKNEGTLRTGIITISSPDVSNSPITVQINQAAFAGPVVAIQEPVSGDVWMLDGTYDINWTASSPLGISEIKIIYLYNGNEHTVATLYTNPGTYSWTIPMVSSYLCSDAQIRVLAFDSNGVWADAFSSTFSVQDSATPPAPWNMPERLTTIIDLGLYVSQDNNNSAIAVDSLGNVHMVYRYVQDELYPGQLRVYKQKIFYQKKINASWTAPEEIYSLDLTSADNNMPGYWFSDFNIAVDSNNHPHISWVYSGPMTDFPDRTGSNGYEIYYLTFNGTSWETAVNVSNNSTYSNYSDIAIDSNDNIHFVWRDGVSYTVTGTYTGISALYHRIKYVDNSWSDTVPVISTDCYGSFPAIAKGQNGEMHLVYNAIGTLEYVLWDDLSWSTSSIIFNDGNQYNYKDIVTDNENKVHVVYGVYGNFGDGDVHQIRYTLFDELMWSTPEIVSKGNNGYQKVPEVTLNSQNWPQFVWYENSSTVPHIYYKQKTAHGWSNTTQLNTAATIPNHSSFNAVSIGASSDDILHVVWPSYFDGGDEVYYTYADIGSSIDSDGDGLTDDIESGNCTDSNDADTDDDGILDGAEDINHNGILDSGETNPCDNDSDNDDIQDGTEKGYTLNDIGSDTNTSIFIPDVDPSTTTNPLDDDSDDDGYKDGEEDLNKNGWIDSGETDPNDDSSFPIPIVAPTINTADVSSITANSAICGGNVTSDGGAEVTARGVCYSLAENPEVDGSKTSEGTGIGSFISNLTGLDANRTYHVRAYATNSVGTSYGADRTFTTLQPEVTFSAASQSASEDVGSTTVSLQLSVVSALDVTVPFTLSGSATEGSGGDYTISTTPVTIPAGSVSETITITINDDALLESDETVIINMGAPTNATLGDITVHTTTITDNEPNADIAIQKTVNNSKPKVGEQVTYDIIVTNNGPDDATLIQVTDTLPTGLLHVASQGSYNPNTGIWNVGALVNGTSATLQITATVTQSGKIINTATKTESSPQDPNTANDSDEAVIVVGNSSMPWLYLLLSDVDTGTWTWVNIGTQTTTINVGSCGTGTNSTTVTCSPDELNTEVYISDAAIYPSSQGPEHQGHTATILDADLTYIYRSGCVNEHLVRGQGI